MTAPTSMGNHGGTVTSCSPYAYPGFAEICILLRTWSTVTPRTCELAFLIKKKQKKNTFDVTSSSNNNPNVGEPFAT